MTPDETGQILEELGGIKVLVHEIRSDVAEVKTETKATNGRVTAIEKRHEREDTLQQERDHVAHARAEAHHRWGGWFAPVVTGVSTGTIMLVITLLATGKF